MSCLELGTNSWLTCNNMLRMRTMVRVLEFASSQYMHAQRNKFQNRSPHPIAEHEFTTVRTLADSISHISLLPFGELRHRTKDKTIKRTVQLGSGRRLHRDGTTYQNSLIPVAAWSTSENQRDTHIPFDAGFTSHAWLVDRGSQNVHTVRTHVLLSPL